MGETAVEEFLAILVREHADFTGSQVGDADTIGKALVFRLLVHQLDHLSGDVRCHYVDSGSGEPKGVNPCSTPDLENRLTFQKGAR